MRLLHPWNDSSRQVDAFPARKPVGRNYPPFSARQHLPLHRIRKDPRGHQGPHRKPTQLRTGEKMTQVEQTAHKPHVIIAGAGMGGLTLAAALLQKGFDIDIYEQSPELREVGAGLWISANGSCVMAELGL